jgi:hypothetical protein
MAAPAAHRTAVHTTVAPVLTGIAARAGAADPDALGRQLLMLVEGATVVAAHHGAAEAAAHARTAALALLAAGS